jgi:hypothetical protein
LTERRLFPKLTRLKAGRFLQRKEIWIPTLRGWLLLLSILFLAAVIALKLTVPFLSPNSPIGAEVLVVEGWVDDYTLTTVIGMERTNHYKMVICAGGPIEKGLNTTVYGTFANLGAARLKTMGYSDTNLFVVASPLVEKDRTYHSALAVKDYLLRNTAYRSIDIVSSSVHSRRSWMLYRLACRPAIKVGVYAIDDPEFDLKRWYKKSAGVRSVLSEVIGYLYARFLFRPAAYEPLPPATNAPVLIPLEPKLEPK